jgi:carbon-monoxide dehydrogenase medium subunit
LTGDAFERFTPRSAMDIAIASAAAHVTLSAGTGTIRDARIALGAVAPTPTRAPGAEDWLRDKEPTVEISEEAGKRAMGECSPIDDIRGSAAYRRELVRVLVKRVLQRAIARAQASP